MAIMILLDKLINSIENGEIVVGVYLDFSKAFDTVDHDILLSCTIMESEVMLYNGLKVICLKESKSSPIMVPLLR